MSAVDSKVSKPMAERIEDVTITDDPTEEVKIHSRTLLAVAAITFLTFAQMITILGSGLLAQSTAGLFGDSSKSVWFSSILTINGLALMPLVGQAADYFGRKWITVTISALGVIGPLVISRAQNISTAIGGFIILGPAMATQATIFAIPSEIVPRKYRAIVQSVLSVATAAGAIVGNLMGGALLRDGNRENYRIFWYIAAGLYLAGVFGIVVGYNPPPRELEQSLTTFEKLQRLDFVGLFLLGGGLALFSIGLQWAQNPYSWSDGHVLGPFIVGLVLIIGFAYYAWRIKKDGLLDHRLFGDRNFPLVLVAIFLEGLAFFACNSYMAYELSVLLHLDLLESGYRMVVSSVGTIVLAPIVGIWITRTKQLREPTSLGFVLFVLAFGLLAGVKADTPDWKMWIYALLPGLGLGFVLSPCYVTAQMSTPPEMISVTTSITAATRSLGGAVGLAVNNALFAGTLNKNLPKEVAAAVLPLGFPATQIGTLISALSSGNPEAIMAVSGATPEILDRASSAYTSAYLKSFRNAWIAACAFSVVGLICALCFRNPKSAFNDHIDAPVETKATHSEESKLGH